MTGISASAVRDLRVRTGAGMMDCKKALTENQGDMDAAVDWLRKKGLAAAARKAGRAAAEGLVALHLGPRRGAIVEVNSETDFVARNAAFQDFARTVAAKAATVDGDLDRLLAAPVDDSGRPVSAELTGMIARIGENLTIRRAATLQVPAGVVAGYVHNQVAPEAGRIGVLVGLHSSADPEALTAFGRKLAMHVAAAQPRFVSTDAVEAGVLARERAVLEAQARESGRPAAVIDRMVEGRLRKFYEEVVLLEQTYVIEGDRTVAAAVAGMAEALGAEIAITGFVRFATGEGVERKADDFAGEVARLAGEPEEEPR